MSMIRTNWAAVGAAIAITLGAGGIAGVQASLSSGDRAVYVPITPCRLIDTRPEFQVGTRSTPLGPAETITLSTYGSNGQCTLPGDFTGVVLNVTAVGATQPTFLTIWPTGASQPNASSLNPQPGAPPTPNAVTTKVSAAGQFNVYNLQGTVHLLADIVGYYVHHTHDDRYYTEAEIDAWLATPVADVMSVPAAAFTPRYSASTEYEIGSGAQLFVTAPSTNDTFVAPAQFPDGAVLTEMSVSLWDDSTTSLEVSLYRIPSASPVFDPIFGVVSATNAPGTQILTDTEAPTAGHRVVDNSTYTYILWVSCPGSWASEYTDLRLHAVTISYEWWAAYGEHLPIGIVALAVLGGQWEQTTSMEVGHICDPYTLGAGGIAGVQASLSSGDRAVYVPITPCRLIDTRPKFQVGTRSTPLGPAETITLSTYGSNGQCTLPGDFTGVVLNVTAVGREADPVPSTANQVARSTFTVRSAMLSPGDSVIVGLFRSYNNDTCSQPLQIKGIRILYD